ncbi:hypothetical protein I7I50_12569 [Histoplasma capsulatum G186AR]|uniref:Uncharacterized protein n=1 Tax=Ajellomyces capsulatus TaxID=5037 RepID=A0A8H8CRS6_AJECA|nr:hypothetical protein I7I52_11126 [Histoplasma capsulatum]QSS70817.1 hypothetical protein I7I50_12569 [Histoplasma capsulatum G186AR]
MTLTPCLGHCPYLITVSNGMEWMKGMKLSWVFKTSTGISSKLRAWIVQTSMVSRASRNPIKAISPGSNAVLIQTHYLHFHGLTSP